MEFFGLPSFFRAPSFIFSDFVDHQHHENGFRVPRPPYSNRNFQQDVQKPVNLKKQQSVKKSKENYTVHQGQYWDIEGIEAMERKEYQQAIECFTKAIDISEGTESGYFRNRGEAYKRIGQYELALKDAIQSIELDDKNIKAHLLCGQVMAEKGKKENSVNNINTAIVRLTKAMTLCAGQKKEYYEAQLSKYIYRAKKLLWYKQQEINNNQKRIAISNYKQYLETQNCSEESKTQQIDCFIQAIGDPDKKLQLDIPEYLICKITLDVMENPVVTEAGHCYEKEVLEEHLMKNGGIDPSTRKPISGKYYENYNIKQAIQYFLLNNPWAFEFTPGEDYNDIEF